MALLIEDGTLTEPNAESYVDIVYVDAYFEERDNPDAWAECLTVDAKEAAIRYASLYFENNYKFKGCLQDVAQPLNWPRTSFYDCQGRLHAGEGVIPDRIKQAVAELTLRQLVEPLYAQPSPTLKTVVSETVGDHSITFDGSQGKAPNFRIISQILKPYLDGSPSIIPLYRG